MQFQDIMAMLEQLGSEQTKKVLKKHGAQEPFFGVKVSDLKVLVKRIKKDHALALQLYETGNSDAMYLAGLIADPSVMTKNDLQQWVNKANWHMLSDYTVAWCAAESPHGWQLGMEWIDRTNDLVASAGWNTLAAWVSRLPDDELDFHQINDLIHRVEKTIQQEKNRTRYAMNGFLISTGISVPHFTDSMIEVSERIGKIEVNMGDTACQVPFAPTYIRNAIQKGRIGKKKIKLRC